MFPPELLVRLAKSSPYEMLLVNKQLTPVASDVLTCQRREFLKKLAQDLLEKGKFEPSHLENYETLKAKAISQETLNTSISCWREAIAFLYKGIQTDSDFFKKLLHPGLLNYGSHHYPFHNYYFPIHIDRPLFLSIIPNNHNDIWITDILNMGYNKEYTLCYLTLVEKNFITPERLYLEIELAPFNSVFAKSIAQAVSKCSSLERIKLYFDGWEHEYLEQVLTALKENQKVHSAFFCDLTPIKTEDIDNLVGWKEYIPFISWDLTNVSREIFQKSFPPKCSNLIKNILGEHFQIEYTSIKKNECLRPSISLQRIVKQDLQEL